MGTIIEGPTEFFSARLSNKDRKRTLVEDVLASENASGRFKAKYGEIQASKTSGKKQFYKNLKAKRRNKISKGWRRYCSLGPWFYDKVLQTCSKTSSRLELSQEPTDHVDWLTASWQHFPWLALPSSSYPDNSSTRLLPTVDRLLGQDLLLHSLWLDCAQLRVRYDAR